jgi:ferritin-like metal-binding protein YciE
MKQLTSMKELLVHELEDLYHAEKQLLKVLPRIADKASSSDLKSAFKEHAQQTKEHVHRLEECFQKLGEKASAHECQAMKGIIAEAEEVLAQEKDGELLDAALIGAAQKAEHYEIASYGTVAEWAKALGQEEVRQLLGQTLDEEEETDGRLTTLARQGINQAAKAK